MARTFSPFAFSVLPGVLPWSSRTSTFGTCVLSCIFYPALTEQLPLSRPLPGGPVLCPRLFALDRCARAAGRRGPALGHRAQVTPAPREAPWPSSRRGAPYVGRDRV